MWSSVDFYQSHIFICSVKAQRVELPSKSMCVYMTEESHHLFCSSPQTPIPSKQFFSFMDLQLYVPAWYEMRQASSTAVVNSTGPLCFLQQQSMKYFLQTITVTKLFN